MKGLITIKNIITDVSVVFVVMNVVIVKVKNKALY